MKRKMRPVKPNICVGFSNMVFLIKKEKRRMLNVLLIIVVLIFEDGFCVGCIEGDCIKKMLQIHLGFFIITIFHNNRKTF